MNETVLLIDDNEELLENTAEILELANYKVIKAFNGKTGMELALKTKPDIILCDVMMPMLDGYGVLRALRNQPKFSLTPFIFVTAKSENDNFRHGMDLGADDYLVKPFTGEQLLSIVSARINRAERLKIAVNKTNMTMGLDSNISLPELLKEFLDGKIKVKKIKKREHLYLEGEDSNYFYQLMSGRIKTFKTNESGKEYITNIYQSGDFFGFCSFLDNQPRFETAETIEDSEIKIISKPDFIEALNQNPKIASKLLQHILNKLAEMNESMIKLAYNSARKRVAEAIIYISKKYSSDSKMLIDFPMNRNDLSALSGIAPESVSRNLTDFKAEGLIEINDGIIKILNYNKLNNLKN